MKIRPVEAEMFHANGRTHRHTEMTKLTAAFRNLANEPKNGYFQITAIYHN